MEQALIFDIVISIFTSLFIMAIIFNKQLQRLINYFDFKSKAIIVIDMQNDFLSDEGFFAKTNRNTQLGRNIIPNINLLTESFRKSNKTVIFIHSLYGECKEPNLPPDFIQPLNPLGRSFNIPLNDVLRSGSHKQGQITCCAKGDTHGLDFYKDIQIQDTDIKVQKEYYSSFRKTQIQNILKEKFIKDIVIVGVSTNYCVTAATIDAFHLGFNVTLITDGVAASNINLHEKAIEKLKPYCKQTTTKEFLNTFI